MENTNNTTESGASPSGEAAPAKTKPIAPLSFRPTPGEMHVFLKNLIEEHGSTQRAMQFCVEKAMASSSEDPQQTRTTEMELRRIISDLEDELLKQNPKGIPVSMQLSPDQEAFIQKIITKKKTDRDNAIKFCILYTKENKLWF